MGNDSLSMNYLKKIIKIFKEEIIKFKLSIYVFGSYLYKCNPNDIDILLLYSVDNDSVIELIEFKNRFKIYLQELILKDIDLVILTYEEDDEMKFIKNESAVKLVDYRQYI